ncbi:MAG: ATP-binding protein [Verrucomicrobia bacterium]|nr:ATP-binding protein [Verrucomicrobiota bacterium]
MKFTSSGAVVLYASYRDGALWLTVEDTGKGIPLSAQAQLFQRFQQVEASAGTESGTGLGLSLVRDFARLMGGEVNLTSEPGVGTKVTVTVLLPSVQGVVSAPISTQESDLLHESLPTVPTDPDQWKSAIERLMSVARTGDAIQLRRLFNELLSLGAPGVSLHRKLLPLIDDFRMAEIRKLLQSESENV